MKFKLLTFVLIDSASVFLRIAFIHPTFLIINKHFVLKQTHIFVNFQR